MEVSWLADTCGSRPHSGQCSYLGEARDIKVGFPWHVVLWRSRVVAEVMLLWVQFRTAPELRL